MLGGPVVLGKLYDGRNKTFFFTNFDYTRIRSGVLPGFGNTTPIDAFKNGDFSALLTGQQVGVDALGRPILGGQIFNPATTRLVNGVPVRDPYPNNQIPAGDPLRSQVAAKIAALMVQPDRAGVSFNVAGNPAGDQTWELNARNILARVDHVLHAELPDERHVLLEPPPVDPQLRRRRRLHDRVRRRVRAAEEHLLHRRGLLPAHLHASRSTSSSTG